MIPVCYSTDHNFIMPVGVSMQSMLECSKDVEIEVFILQSETVTDEDRKILISISHAFDTKINFISMGKTFNNGYEVRDISYAAYFRLLIPWLIPQYDKLIYCDGDTVFCDSVKGLYDVEIGDNFVAALCPYKYDHTSFETYAPKLGIKPENYFQTGVMVINAKAQRDSNLVVAYREAVGNKYHYLDQDILNIVCKGKVADMSPRYNVIPSFYERTSFDDEYLEALKKPTIVHFAGAKPWNKFLTGWYRWWDVYRRSVFFDEKKEIKIVANSINPSNKELIKLLIRRNLPLLYKIRQRFLN